MLLAGTLIATSYRSVPNQTDNSPFITSIGEHCYNGGAAISQDKLCKVCRRAHKRCKEPSDVRYIHYGDCLYIEGIGFKIVNDCMGKYKHYRIKTKQGFKSRFIKQENWIDVWVGSYKDEHLFHKKFGMKQHKIWIVKETYETH